MALIVRYILEFKLKKLLLIVLLLAQPIYADSNGMSKLIIPQDICDIGNPSVAAQEAVEREIAEFEAQLAQELAEKAAQEMMVEIEAEFKGEREGLGTILMKVLGLDEPKFIHGDNAVVGNPIIHRAASQWRTG